MEQSKSAKRKLLPIALSAAVVYLLIGCFYVPTTRQRTSNGDRRPESLIGSANSRKPIQLGVTTLEDAMSIIGARTPSGQMHYRVPQNWFVLSDGKRYAFYYFIDEGYWIWPLCFYASPKSAERVLILKVDDNNIVIGYEVRKALGEPATRLFPQRRD